MKVANLERARLVDAGRALDVGDHARAGRELDQLPANLTPLAASMAEALRGRAQAHSRAIFRRDHDFYVRAVEVQRRHYGGRLRLWHTDPLALAIANNPGAVVVVIGVEHDALPRAFAAVQRQLDTGVEARLAIIDPLANEARHDIDAVARLPGVELIDAAVFPTTIEALTEADWDRLRALGQRFVVSAMLTLHYIREPATRDAVLARLAALGQVELLLQERDLDLLHNPSLEARVALTWDYFEPVYAELESMTMAADDRQLFHEWYAISVQDCLSEPRESLCSCPYHEDAASWSRRVRAAGFELSDERVEVDHARVTSLAPRLLERDQTLLFGSESGSEFASLFFLLRARALDG